MLKRFPQLQSGFLSPSEEIVIKPTLTPQTPYNTILRQQPTRQQQDMFYSPQVDMLVREMMNTPMCLRDFDWQEKAFSTIAKALGNAKWGNFIRVQTDCPSMSTTHVHFLEETTEIVIGARTERLTTLELMSSLLSAANKPMGGFRPSEFGRKFYSSGVLDWPLDEFLVKWVQNAGFHDLILSMQVIFGRRGMHAMNAGVN